MAETYTPQDNPKTYTGDSVYERAKKFLEDKARGGTDTSTENITLDTIVTKTKEYRNAKSTVTEKRAAARELARIGLASIDKTISLDEIKSGTYRPGVSPMNYIDGATVRTNPDGTRYEGTYKTDHSMKEGRVINLSGAVDDGVRVSQLGTGILEYGVFRDPNGDIAAGKIDQSTARLVDGTYTHKNGSSRTGIFDPKTGFLIRGKIQYANGDIYEGDLKDGNFQTGILTGKNGTRVEYRDRSRIEPAK